MYQAHSPHLQWPSLWCLAPCSHKPSLTSSLEVGHSHYIHFFPSPRLMFCYSINLTRAEGLLLCLVGCQPISLIPGAVFGTGLVLQGSLGKVETLPRPQDIQVWGSEGLSFQGAYIEGSCVGWGALERLWARGRQPWNRSLHVPQCECQVEEESLWLTVKGSQSQRWEKWKWVDVMEDRMDMVQELGGDQLCWRPCLSNSGHQHPNLARLGPNKQTKKGTENHEHNSWPVDGIKSSMNLRGHSVCSRNT